MNAKRDCSGAGRGVVRLLSTAALLILVAAVLIWGHLLPGLDANKIQGGVRNALHVVAFAAFAGFVFTALRPYGVIVAIIATVLLVGLTAGSAEFIQYLRGTTPDVRDIVRDMAGLSLSITAIILWNRSRADETRRSTRIMLRSFSFACLLAVLSPLLFWALVTWQGKSAFPSLVTFDAPWEEHTWFTINATLQDVAVPVDAAAGSGNAVGFDLWRNRKTGISLMPVQHDWSEYEYLVFDAWIAKGPDTRLTVRINDGDRYRRYDDRFTHEILVTDTPAEYRLRLEDLATDPGLQNMNLADIRQVTFLAPRRRPETTMVIDQVRVE